MHARARIKTYIFNILETEFGQGAVFKDVFDSLESEEALRLAVDLTSESVEDVYEATGLDSQLMDRRLEVQIMAFQNHAPDVDINDISVRIETTMGADPTLDGLLLEDLVLRSTEIQRFDGEDDTVVGIALTYGVLYRTNVGDPTTILV